MIRTLKSFYKKIRDRIKPKRGLRNYIVELKVYNSAEDKYFARTQVVTTARTKNEAAENVQTFVRLHVGKIVDAGGPVLNQALNKQ